MPDIFETNALAYEDARRTVAEFEGTTIADDFKIQAIQHLLKTDPVAALYDALDAAEIASHDGGPDFLDRLETFCKLATKVVLPKTTTPQEWTYGARHLTYLVSVASNLYYDARVERSETGINPDRYRKPLERMANAIWPSELMFAHRLQDANGSKIAFRAHDLPFEGSWPMLWTHKADGGTDIANPLIVPRQTKTEVQRLSNAINRCLQLTPSQVAAITTGEPQNSEAA